MKAYIDLQAFEDLRLALSLALGDRGVLNLPVGQVSSG
jgi:hypothetical protein